MSVNLLESAKSYLNHQFVSQVSTQLDENPQGTQKTFEGALSVILSGLIQRSFESSGPILIMDLIGELMLPTLEPEEVPAPTDNLIGQLAGWLTNQQESGSVIQMGAELLQGIFEEKTIPLTNTLAAYSGVRKSSSATITNLAGFVLINLLTEQVSENYQGLSGLTNLLDSQVDYVESAFPSGLGSLLASAPGLNNLNRLTDKTASPIPSNSIPADEEASPGRAHWLLWLLLALGVISLVIIFRTYS